MWLVVVRFCLIRLNHFRCFSWNLVILFMHCWWPWCLCTQGCTIKDWHPAVAMPFCDPQLLCALRALMAGQMGGKGKATHRSLVPSAWDVTLVQMFTLFFILLPAELFQLIGKWPAFAWDLKVMNSIALSGFVDVVSRWLWWLCSLYVGVTDR